MDLEIHNSQIRNGVNVSNYHFDNHDLKIKKALYNYEDKLSHYEEKIPKNCRNNNNLLDLNMSIEQIKRLDIIEITQVIIYNEHKNSNASFTILNDCCRVCYEKGDAQNPLINPCLCEGSMKFIHEACLKRWIESNFKKIENGYCEICKYKYKVKLIYNYKYECDRIFQLIKNYIVILLVTSIVCGFILSIIFMIINIIFNMDQIWRKRSICILSSAGFLILFMINCSFCYNCRKIYFKKTLKNWKFYVYEGTPKISLS